MLSQLGHRVILKGGTEVDRPNVHLGPWGGGGGGGT